MEIRYMPGRTWLAMNRNLIAESLPGVPVVVGAVRHLAAMTAYERFKPDVILLDDGFSASAPKQAGRYCHGRRS